MKRAAILYLSLAGAAIAGESIIIPENAVDLFTGQVLSASTKVTSSTSVPLERTRTVVVEVDLGVQPVDAETIVITPLYVVDPDGNSAGYAVPKIPTDSVTIVNPWGANFIVEIDPPAGASSMKLMVESSATNTIGVVARGK